MASLPISLQTLVEATEYPPETPTLLQVSTTKVVMIVDTVSPTPFSLLRRAKNFEYRDDHWHLQGLGSVCEMGDAVLGLVAADLGPRCPPWLAIRNVSDPQIKAEGSRHDQANVAGTIYKGFGRWSSVCSAIACWAAIVATPV